MKKIILVLAVLFFTVSSSLSAANLSGINSDSDCLDRVYITMNQAYNAGWDDEQVLNIVNIELAVCMGYTMEEIANAQ